MRRRKNVVIFATNCGIVEIILLFSFEEEGKEV